VPFYSGKDGELLIDDKKAAKVKSWSIASDMSVLETTTLGDIDKTSVAGIRTTTGTCDLFYYSTDANDVSKNDASVLIRHLIKKAEKDTVQGDEADEVKIRLRINDGTTDKKYIEGQCWLKNASMNMAVGEVLSAKVSFEFIGAPRELLI